MLTFFGDIWQALKDHDAPNWFVIFVSLFVWPAILSAFFYWWNNRQWQSVPHLEVVLNPFEIQVAIDREEYNAVKITFNNRTGAVVYLHHARLREVARRFPIPQTAARDISGGWRQLKFANSTGTFLEHECILQATQSAVTYMAVTQTMPNAFYVYQPGWLRRRFRYPKYFLMEYVVMVGEKKYSVAFVY